MAALMCARFFPTSFRFSYSLIGINVNNIVIQEGICSLGVTGSLVNDVQKRYMSRVKRRTTHAPRHWVLRRQKFIKENISADNSRFVQEVIDEKYPPGIRDSPLKDSPWPRGEWQGRGEQRTGLIARKIGIYPLWYTDGSRVWATLLQVCVPHIQTLKFHHQKIVDNHVIRYVPPDVLVNYRYGSSAKGRLGALVVGAERRDPRRFTEAYNGLFKEAGVMPKSKLSRFYITPNAAIQPGTPLTVNHFRVGDYVDVYGKTIDHGFQGVMKRWGMKGGPATHGTTKAHRRVGSIGTGRNMSRVWPGKKMPGHMGQERRFHNGLQILRINTKYNVMWVKGNAVPGHVHHYVNIMDSFLPHRKHTAESPPPFPTYYDGEQSEPFPEEQYAPGIHPFIEPSISFDDEPEVAIPTVGAKKAKVAKAKR